MTRGGFVVAVVAGWIVLGAAGAYYARLKQIPSLIAAPVLAAFLLEYVFYIAPGFSQLRKWMADRIPPRPLALLLAISALAPYLLYSLATGQFRVVAASRLAALVFALSFWYIIRRPAPAADLAFLTLVAAALVAKFFRHIYLSPIPSVPVDALGHLMLIRLAAAVMLMLREVEGTGFGFLPTAREWAIGLRYFLYFLPVGAALSAGLGLAHFRTSPILLARAPIWFLGTLWVLALSEEFLARGLLQRWISDWTGRPQFALLFASVAFGFCHLWFRGFPNWRFAIVAAVAGWFYGKAYERGQGIRAAMVTHALAVTVWQTLSA